MRYFVGSTNPVPTPESFRKLIQEPIRYLVRSRTSYPRVFRLLSQFTGEHETHTGLLASLRTWRSDARPAVNHGALFGFLREHRALANGIFAVVSTLAALAIAYWGSYRLSANDGILTVALGLIRPEHWATFTTGSFLARCDFLHFYWFEWPVFNVADCCLVCGAGLLLLQAFWVQPSAPQKTTSGEEKVGAEVVHSG